MNEAPGAPQSRDPARPQAGNPTLSAASEELNSIPFPRFRKSRENCISVESFFLLQIGPASLGSDLGTAALK